MKFGKKEGIVPGFGGDILAKRANFTGVSKADEQQLQMQKGVHKSWWSWSEWLWLLSAISVLESQLPCMKSIPSEQGTKASTSMYIDNMYDKLKPYGLLQFVRSGRIAITKPKMAISELLAEIN